MQVRKSGMGTHQSTDLQNDEWLTPPRIINSLGEFDLDPCAPVYRPWDTANKHFTLDDNGLLQPWDGRVWLNPPYGRYTSEWINKLSLHGNGIALIFARTETSIFQDYIFPSAKAIFFIKGRLHFHHIDGRRSIHNAGAPSVLIAYGDYNAQVLKTCGLRGKYIPLH